MSAETDQLLMQIAEVRHQAQECRDTAVVNVLDACRDHIVRTFVTEAGNPLLVLPETQQRIAMLIGKGYANKDIAEMLELARPTIAVYKHAAFKTLGISNDFELVMLLVRYGVVVP